MNSTIKIKEEHYKKYGVFDSFLLSYLLSKQKKHPNKYIRHSRGDLGALMGCSKVTITRCIRKFQKINVIEIKKDKFGYLYFYVNENVLNGGSDEVSV